MTEAQDSGLDRLALDIGNPLIWPLVPVAARGAVDVLWRLNRRLCAMALAPSEPMLRQIRLRWWADQLASLDVNANHAEPLLAATAQLLVPALRGADLVRLAEAWMERIDASPAASSGGEGAALFTMTAHVIGGGSGQCDAAGVAWANIAHADAGRGAEPDWPSLAAAVAAVPASGLPPALAALLAQAGAVARAGGKRRPVREQLAILRIGLFAR